LKLRGLALIVALLMLVSLFVGGGATASGRVDWRTLG